MSRMLLIGLFSLTLLSACGWLDEQNPAKGWSAQKLYTEAKKALDDGDYESAIQYYEILEAKFPLGRRAQQAQLDMIYAYYKFEEPESARVAADRFIKLYPRHPQVDYVYYMKGLIHFNATSGLLENMVDLDMSRRDQNEAREAFLAFKDLVRRFPESRYAEDARQRMVFQRNVMARYEINVADFYLRRKAYLAASRRAQYLLENYDRSPAVPKALVILVQAYKKMGLGKLADDALRVMEINYPDHPRLPELRAMETAPVVSRAD